MKKTYLPLVAPLLACCAVAMQSPLSHASLIPVQSHPNPAPDNADPSWMTKPWVNDDNAYAQVERDVDQAVQLTSSIPRVLDAYYDAYTAAPANPMAAFAWGYAADASFLRGHNLQDAQMIKVMDAVRAADPTTSYEFTRLRFIVDAESGHNDNWDCTYLTGVGDRLMAHGPHDDHVAQTADSSLGNQRAGIRHGTGTETRDNVGELRA